MATGDFHINDEYPYSSRPTTRPASSSRHRRRAATSTFSKAAGDWQKNDEKTGRHDGEVPRRRAGHKSVAGTFKLSVCSAQTCLLEQRQVHGERPSTKCDSSGHRALVLTLDGMSEPRAAASQVNAIAEQVEQRFRAGRRVLSFAEFLELFDAEPVRYSRDASRYLRDVFDHYGTTTVVHPWGEFTRFKLFDLPWEPAAGERARASRRARASTALPRARSSARSRCRRRSTARSPTSSREGRPNRLVLLHGPNGSAKSTIAPCMMAGARALLDARRGGALPLPLGLPVAEDDARLARLRPATRRRRAWRSRTRTSPTRRSTPS